MTVTKPVGVALSGAHLAALLSDRDLSRELDRAPVSFAVAGSDRIDDARRTTMSAATAESTIAVTALSARIPHLGWLAAAAVHRDHPYNLARRVASADHLSGGRVGLLLGLRDGYAPAGPRGREVWGGAGLSEGLPLAVETTADAAQAIRKLWHSWPAESIVADRDTRIYAHGDRIVHIDHRGLFEIAGPLTVPTTPQGTPVLAWRADTPGELAVAAREAEAVVCPFAVDAVRSRADAAPVFVEIEVRVGRDPRESVVGGLAQDHAAGVILRPEPSVDGLRELTATLLPSLRAAGVISEPLTGTLRQRMGLRFKPPSLGPTRPAFPAPLPAAAAPR